MFTETKHLLYHFQHFSETTTLNNWRHQKTSAPSENQIHFLLSQFILLFWRFTRFLCLNHKVFFYKNCLSGLIWRAAIAHPPLTPPIEAQLVDDDVINACPRHLSSGSQMQDNARVFFDTVFTWLLHQVEIFTNFTELNEEKNQQKSCNMEESGQNFFLRICALSPFPACANVDIWIEKSRKKKIHYRVNRPFNLHPEIDNEALLPLRTWTRHEGGLPHQIF